MDGEYSKDEQIQKINEVIDNLIDERKQNFYNEVINEIILENIEFYSDDVEILVNYWRDLTMNCPNCDSNILPYIHEMDCPNCDEKLIIDRCYIVG